MAPLMIGVFFDTTIIFSRNVRATYEGCKNKRGIHEQTQQIANKKQR